MLGHVNDFFNVKESFAWVGELTPGIIDPRDGGGQHVERVAGEIDDAGFGEEFGERFDLGAEGGVFGHEIFFAVRIHVPLDHGAVKGHDAFFMFRAKGFVEMLVVGEFIHEGEEEGDEVAVPDMQMDVLVLFGLKEGDGMNFDLSEGGGVEFVQQLV